MLSRSFRTLLVLAGSGIAVTAASAEVIYETEDPFGGFFGVNGLDVFQDQSVGVRFTPDGNYILDSIKPWFMNNDGSGDHFGLVRLSLRNDNNNGSVSIPGDTIYESWEFNVSAVGWDPVLEEFDSQVQPLLQSGVNYWIVAESDDPPVIDPVWCFASEGNGFTATTAWDTGEWQPGGFGAVVAVIVEGTPAAIDGDLDGDCDVDLSDLSVLLGNFGSGGAGHEDGDIDGDGEVTLADLSLLLGNFGGVCQ